ncbi:MAG: hypothetical protein K0Q95_1524 [Bacteroidota bacterium]|jgi:hypothetical protein|nr:hypothetical protein [Bacteroidota bacterium]
MEAPKDSIITETATSTFWIDSEGILCAVSKKGPPQTLEEVKAAMALLRSNLPEGKVCLLIDVTNSNESSRESRNYAAEEFPKFIKAIAMISSSELGKMLANLFFNIKQQPYPTKMFTNESEARAWLKQYQ